MIYRPRLRDKSLDVGWKRITIPHPAFFLVGRPPAGPRKVSPPLPSQRRDAHSCMWLVVARPLQVPANFLGPVLIPRPIFNNNSRQSQLVIYATRTTNSCHLSVRLPFWVAFIFVLRFAWYFPWFSYLVRSYRGAFFPKIPKFGNNRRYLSVYGGVLSLLFVKFSGTKNIKFVNLPIFGKTNRKIILSESFFSNFSTFFSGNFSIFSFFFSTQILEC